VHQYDRERAESRVVYLLQIAAGALFIERNQYIATGADTLNDLGHVQVKQFGQHDMAVEYARPVLVGDSQSIAKIRA